METLKVENLEIRFGGLVAINSLSFETREKEILSIIGPNGAGKTTLFNAITGFLKPARGKIFWRDIDITGFPPYRVTELGIARTFQKRSFFPALTVLENVLLGCHLKNSVSLGEALLKYPALKKEQYAKEYAMELLDFVGLKGKEYLLACNLPYGEQRLLGIAIALASRPKLLLLDEPCAGSNPAESQNITRLIENIKHMGITVILVEHHMRVVMSISDRIIVLSSGEKLAEGSAKEIQDDPKVIEAYLGRKSEGNGLFT